MGPQDQIDLLEEIDALGKTQTFFMDETISRSPVERYTCSDRFDAEMSRIFRAMPVIAAHSSELPDPGSFITLCLAGLPVLLTRDMTGQANAFLNVCRHRGSRLVGEEQGCKKVFSCPYHGWSWDTSGTLRGIPHQEQGFPGLDKNAYGLKRLPVIERLGLIWVIADPAAGDTAEVEFERCLAPLETDFTWMAMDTLAIAHTTTQDRSANWKLLAEGGIEAYHFRVVHKRTIGPHFMDNLSSYQMLGPHMRSILPRTSVRDLHNRPRSQWSIREHANVLYTLMPMDQFLLMQDHIAWIHAEPLAADRTRLRVSTLVPAAELTQARHDHWARNHDLTCATLDEDFEVNEHAQSGLTSGANDTLTFGRFESALHAFNSAVEARLNDY